MRACGPYIYTRAAAPRAVYFQRRGYYARRRECTLSAHRREPESRVAYDYEFSEPLAMREEVEEELELCEAVFAEELSVNRAAEDTGGDSRQATLALQLSPNTCDDESQLFVKLTLELTLGASYPDQPPWMSVSSCKGLDDAQLASLLAALAETAAESPGEPVILALVERTKDFLDENNAPPAECSICLEPFHPSDASTGGPESMELLRLDCFHCFHTGCCARWRLSILAAAEAKRAANPHAAGINTPPPWTCTTCRAPLGKVAQAAVERAIEVETREERLVNEHAQSVASYASVKEDGSDKQVAEAAKAVRVAELALEEERERRRELEKREAAFARDLSDTGQWRTAAVEEAAAVRRRQYEQARERGGLIDETWLRRVAAAGTIERAQAIEAGVEAEAKAAQQAQEDKANAAKAKATREARAATRADTKRTTSGPSTCPGDDAKLDGSNPRKGGAGANMTAANTASKSTGDAAAAAKAALAQVNAKHHGGVHKTGRGRGRDDSGGDDGTGKGSGQGKGRGRGRGRSRGKRGGRRAQRGGSVSSTSAQGSQATTPRS